MGKFVLTLTIIACSMCSSCMTTASKAAQEQNNPCSYFILQKEGFSVGYDGRLKQAA